MKKKFRPSRMVNWFDPGVLLQTGVRSWVSSTFGNYADRREMESVLDKDLSDSSYLANIPNQEDQEKAQKDRYWKETQNQDDIWVDFISDSGDGFDSTYAVAFAAAQSNLKVNGLSESLPRADIVILGGDQVYPSPTKDAYENRFRIPYEVAVYVEHQESALTPENRGKFYDRVLEKMVEYNWGFPHDERGLIPESNPKKHRYLFAIPGNHDWYDGLGNFMKIFCQQRWIADWETRQTRSYFAFKLPHNYWIWASDIQLNAEIDMPQLDYFKKVAKEQMHDGDKIILLTAEPAWVYKQLHKHDSSFEKLMFFIDKQINRKGIDACELELPLVLTGDLHHYSRYATSDPDIKSPQFIGAGGGGAFLHLTHNLPPKLDKPDSKNLELKATYPTKKDSKDLLKGNLAFFYFNPVFSFGLLGGLYVLFLWLLQSNSIYTEAGYMQDISRSFFTDYVCTTWKILIVSPFTLLLTIALLLGLTFFADTKTKTKNVHVYGFLLGFFQVSAIYLSIWMLASIHNNLLDEWWIWIIFIVELVAAGGIIGGFIMGLYLYFTNRFTTMHLDESSSSLASPHYKSFLRLHISSKGITIYPVGIKNVEKMYSKDKTPDEILFSSKVPTCELIENPIFIKSTQP